MRTDVIVKTWWNDLSFCSYCLRFLEKNWQEPNSEIIVLANTDCQKVCQDWRFSDRVRYYYLHPWPDGNQFQCYLKFLPDNFSDADVLASIDYDCILTEPMRASDKMSDNKPIICYEPLSEMVKNPGRIMAINLWFPIMEYWLGQQPEADYMCRFPLMYRADTIRAVRRLITRKSGVGLPEALYSDVPFRPENFPQHPFKMCEHNVLGFSAYLHQRDRYEFAPMAEASWPVRQYHSWTQWSAERQTELESILMAT